MTREEFVTNIKQVLRDSDPDALIASYQTPPGRNPTKKVRRMSSWYNSLSEEQKKEFPEIVRDVVDSAFFHFFCVLDGVGVIEDGPNRSKYELYAVKDGKQILLNDPQKEMLHDIYQGLTWSAD